MFTFSMNEAVSDYPYRHQTAIVKNHEMMKIRWPVFFSLISYCQAIKHIAGHCGKLQHQCENP